MKTHCIEGSSYGDLVKLRFDIPEQEQVDAGEKPCFVIDALELAVLIEAGEDDEDSCCMFEVGALGIFMDEARNPEEAETVALWLEQMAEQVRAKFSSAGGGTKNG